MTDSGDLGVTSSGGALARQRALGEIIERYCGEDGTYETPVPGLTFHRTSSTSVPVCGVYRSVLALMPQGSKQVTLAGETYRYDRQHYLVTSVDLPVVAQVTAASPAQPLLCFILDLDSRKIGDLISSMDTAGAYPGAPSRGMAVSPLSLEIAEPALRLARLIDTPADIPVLAPLIERELLYRLLTGAQGARLRSLLAVDSQSQRVARAIDWLKSHYDQPLAIDHLADTANMSKSSLHHHFKALTAMSPLQYQKQLRLQEARRLMLMESMDASTVSRRVGYESPSQFSREYRRLFGAPPLKDIARLR